MITSIKYRWCNPQGALVEKQFLTFQKTTNRMVFFKNPWSGNFFKGTSENAAPLHHFDNIFNIFNILRWCNLVVHGVVQWCNLVVQRTGGKNCCTTTNVI
jgi:hypothetical protein